MHTVGELVNFLKTLPPDDDIRTITKHKELRSLFAKRATKAATPGAGIRDCISILRLNEASLPSGIAQRYSQCVADPSTFWDGDHHDLSGIVGDLTSVAKAFALRFRAVHSLQAQNAWQTVQISKNKNMAAVISTLQALMNWTDNEVKKTIEKQCLGGSKYAALAEKFGTGVLFVLPQNISSNIWEYRLPASGQIFERVVTHLTTIGIKDEIQRLDANRIGETITETLMQPFIIMASQITANPEFSSGSNSACTNMARSVAISSINEQPMQAIVPDITYQHNEVGDDIAPSTSGIFDISLQLVSSPSSTLFGGDWSLFGTEFVQ